jgi:hypothetical protein
MTPASRLDFDELDGDETFTDSRRNVPERTSNRSKKQHVHKRATRSRSNEVAKRGMHQRRNKRLSW